MEKILMPKTLTAENGAKAALIGEFKQSVGVTCPICGGSGEDSDDYYGNCLGCGGAGSYFISVPVQWATIKEIYKKAVELLGEEYDNKKKS